MCFQTVPEQIHQGTGGVSTGVSDVHVSVGEKTSKQWECSQGTGVKELLIKSCYKAAKGENTQLFGILQAICHGHYAATT